MIDFFLFLRVNSSTFCQIARKVGDPNIPRPWSRHSLKKQEKSSEEGKEVPGSNSSKIANSKEKKKKEKNKKDDGNDDPQLQEFLDVMQPRSKSKLWANDTLIASSTDQRKMIEDKQSEVRKGDQKSKLNETDE